MKVLSKSRVSLVDYALSRSVSPESQVYSFNLFLFLATTTPFSLLDDDDDLTLNLRLCALDQFPFCVMCRQRESLECLVYTVIIEMTTAVIKIRF